MNPLAAPAMNIIPVKVTMLVQFLVCFGILASTVTITRSVVQSNVAKLNANLAQLQSPSGVLFQQFLNDSDAALDSWRFFFEDDVALHPSLTKSIAQQVLARGLEVAARDGIVYLGICGPKDCKKKVVLASPVEAKQCAGACTHAFGLTKWKTRSFLADMNKLNVTSMYFDQVLRTFGEKVHKIWVLGSNLKSPQAKNHYGLVFQDRKSYPSIIDAREPQH